MTPEWMRQKPTWINNFSEDLKPLQRFLGELLILVLVVAVAVTISLRLWEADFKVPLQYNVKDTEFPWSNFDVSQFLAYLKNGISGGWIEEIGGLGAPKNLESYGFPFAFFPLVIFAASKLITVFTGSSLGWNVNILYLLSFFSAAICAFGVFRLYVSFEVSLVLGVLFAFIPFHFETGMMFSEHGLNYGHVIPISVLIALWLAQGNFFDCRLVDGQPCFRWNSRKIAIAVLLIPFIAMSNTYYPFFSALIWLAAGLIAVINQPKVLRIPSLLMTLGLLLGLGGSLLILISPVILHQLQNPTIVSAFTRSWRDSEFWGLKITQLYLPIRDHYIPALAEFARRYGPYPYAHVNTSVALGAVGIVGFTSLVAVFFMDKLLMLRSDLMRTIASLNLVIVLFATVGGYGTLFALVITPEVRALYRVSPYISFFSFFAVGLLVQHCFYRLAKLNIKSARKSLNRILLLSFILVLGIADQTGYLAIPKYSAISKTFLAHATFFRDLEFELPSGAMVFQVPYEQFPEGGRLNFENRWVANESFIPYLHTKALRWSYGSIHGSQLAAWKKTVAELPPTEMLQNLCGANFAAILLDYEQFSTREQARAMLDRLGQHARLIFEGKEGRYAAFRICESEQR